MRRAALLLVVPAFALLAAGAVLASYLVAAVPLPAEQVRAPTVVTDLHGEPFGELRQREAPGDVVLADLPPHVIDAVLASEDAGFYTHRGVSVLGILRAAYANVTQGGIRQGGSTISQQYIKNLTGEMDDTLLRKVNEAVLAVKLERRYDKDEILTLYLNSIYFGRGAYGIQAASQAYFGVDAVALSPEQAALLAGIIPAPSAWDPSVQPEQAASRYRRTIERLLDEGWISAAEAGRMRAWALEVDEPSPIVAERAPFFLAMVERELVELVGDEQVYRGLEIRTTLDPRLQDLAEERYQAAFDGYEQREVGAGATAPTGALIALDPATGGVRAVVGGRNYAEDQFNLAVGGPQGDGRGAGSTFKPFALAAWLERGWSPESRVDSPAELSYTAEELGIEEPWTVANYADVEHGVLSVREAMWRSSNTAYARVAVEAGPDRVAEVAARAGAGRAERLTADPSLVLGTADVTPLEVATGYNTFAAGGVYRTPTTVQTVLRDGEVIYEAGSEAEQRLTPEVAHTLSDVLRGVIEQGTGAAARIGRPAAGKTGTTEGFGDAWFAGYTPDLTAVVWMGNRNDRHTIAGEPTGGGLPAELWAAFMQAALEGTPPSDFPPASGAFVEQHLAAPEPPVCAEGEILVPADPADPEGTLVCAPDESLQPPDPICAEGEILVPADPEDPEGARICVVEEPDPPPGEPEPGEPEPQPAPPPPTEEPPAPEEPPEEESGAEDQAAPSAAAAAAARAGPAETGSTRVGGRVTPLRWPRAARAAPACGTCLLTRSW